MRRTSCPFSRVSVRRLITIALCLPLIFAAASSVRGQSGRRAPKRAPGTTAPAPEIRTESAPAIVRAEQPEFALYVAVGERDLYQNIPLFLYDSIRTAFIQRIREASAIKVTAGEELHRAEAIKRAKAGEGVYVVLLQLDADAFDPRGPQSRGVDPGRLLIRFTVFAPVTGKAQLDGIVYQQQQRVGRRGGIGLPLPRRTGPLYSEYLLKDAARDAADRVLAELQVLQRRRAPGLTTNNSDASEMMKTWLSELHNQALNISRLRALNRSSIF